MEEDAFILPPCKRLTFPVKTTMQHRRLGFVKRGPVSRAARIRWNQGDSASPRNVNNPILPNAMKSILSATKRSSNKTLETMNQLRLLLKELPPWIHWTSEQDDAMKNLSDQMEKTTEETKQHEAYPVEEERMVAEYLISLNRNHPYMDQFDFKDGKQELMTVYYQWLRYRCDPSNPHAHILVGPDVWVDNRSVREYLKNGWFLHIPSRTLRLHKEIARSFDHDTPQSVERVANIDRELDHDTFLKTE